MSPTQLSLRWLRHRGWIAAVVERWNPHARISQDLWGLDLVAIRPDRQGVLGVQTTSASNLAARVKKLRGIPAVRVWLAAGNSAECHGWAKRGRRWDVVRRVLTVADLGEGGE